MSKNKPPKDYYDVGYKKPPEETRFKKGNSGNPKGRPKGRKNRKTEFLEVGNEIIIVTENGKPRKITKSKAIVKKLYASALQGDLKAAEILIKYEWKFQDELDAKTREETPSVGGVLVVAPTTTDTEVWEREYDEQVRKPQERFQQDAERFGYEQALKKSFDGLMGKPRKLDS